MVRLSACCHAVSHGRWFRHCRHGMRSGFPAPLSVPVFMSELETILLGSHLRGELIKIIWYCQVFLRFRDEGTRFNAAPERLSFPARDRRLCCSGLSPVCPGHCRCGGPARRARRPCQSGKRSTPGQPIWPAPCRLHQAGSPAAARQMASGRGGHPDRRQEMSSTFRCRRTGMRRRQSGSCAS